MRSTRIFLALLLSAGALRLLAPQAMAAVGSPLPSRVEDVVTAAATVLAATLALWYFATATVAVAASLLRDLAGGRLARRRWAAGAARALDAAAQRYGAPVLRHSLGLGIGMGLTLGTTLATADTVELPTDLRPGAPVAGTETRTPPPDVDADAPSSPVPTSAAASGPPPGTGSPETPPTDAASPTPGSRPAGPRTTTGDPDGRETSGHRRHTVEPGECLWHIVAAELGPTAGDAEIAAAWPRWHALNAETIGPDPDLIHPGQVLLVPPTEVGP